MLVSEAVKVPGEDIDQLGRGALGGGNEINDGAFVFLLAFLISTYLHFVNGFMELWTYGIQHIPTLSKAVKTLLKQRHLLLCAGPENVSQGFQVTLILVLPVVRISNGNIYRAIRSVDIVLL